MPQSPPPDPARARSLDDLVEMLRLLKVWAGDPSYETIKERVNAAWAAAGRPANDLTGRSTVANTFQPGRRRMNTDLLLAVVQALHPDEAYVVTWRQTLRAVSGEIEAVSQVRVQASLPRDLPEFTGRTAELDTLRAAARAGEAVVISAIEGMAGVGKTQLAVHAAHRLLRQEPFEHVLFVNLRGFHPDPAQPPAHPAAVLDGFLRLLGVPGQAIPHGLDALTAAYRDRLAGSRALVVLDNAGDAAQVRPLLPATPGCLTLITSRRRLTGLPSVTYLPVDVFTPEEAVGYLAAAVAGVAVGPDPRALALIAEHTGYLPLALSLIAGHIRNTPGWNLTDHADRLDERRRERRLDTGVELALDLSYRHLPADRQRVLRLAALHPGQDLDAYAMAALADTGLDSVRASLADLRADHLLLEAAPGRYSLHDLVRAYATTRSHDEDRLSDRHAALTRLFDHYLVAGAAAMDALHPVEDVQLRARIPAAVTPVPDLSDPEAALAWLDSERPTLITVAAQTATQGWPAHTTRLVRTLARYFGGGHHNDSLTVHSHAHHATRETGDVEGQALALTGIGVAYMRLGRPGPADEHLRLALDLFRQADDDGGQARVLFNLGVVAERNGRYPDAIDYKRQSLELDRKLGNEIGEAIDLAGLGAVMDRAGRFPEALDYYGQSLEVSRRSGNRRGEAYAMNGLGEIEVRSGEYGSAGEHLRQAVLLHRESGNRTGEGGALDSLGVLHTRLGEIDRAVEVYDEALVIFREDGNAYNEAWVLNGLGEAVHAGERPGEALIHHGAARDLAAAIGNDHQLARAHTGLGHAHRALGDPAAARANYMTALALYTELGVPDADDVRACLDAL